MRISDWSSDVCSSDLRLLIADEVGLGKTIEAGLVWTELEQRERLRRVLVVAPAALVQKWRAEMRRRFDPRNEGARSEERRGGEECGRRGWTRWWPVHLKKKHKKKQMM